MDFNIDLEEYEDSDVGETSLDENEATDCDDDEEEALVSIETLNVLPPPPEASYSSKAALKEAVRIWTKQHGYEVVITRSQPAKVHTKYRVECGRSRKTKNKRKLSIFRRQRTTSYYKSR